MFILICREGKSWISSESFRAQSDKAVSATSNQRTSSVFTSQWHIVGAPDGQVVFGSQICDSFAASRCLAGQRSVHSLRTPQARPRGSKYDGFVCSLVGESGGQVVGLRNFGVAFWYWCVFNHVFCFSLFGMMIPIDYRFNSIYHTFGGVEIKNQLGAMLATRRLSVYGGRPLARVIRESSAQGAGLSTRT